jgi:hypothetical protein
VFTVAWWRHPESSILSAYLLRLRRSGPGSCRRLAGSRREFLKLLIPRNLRKRWLLQVSDLYRGFGCLPLRQQVLSAEKITATFPEILERWPFFAIIPQQKDCGERTAQLRMGSLSRLFSAGHMRSPVSRVNKGECNAIRSRRFGHSELTLEGVLESDCQDRMFPTIPPEAILDQIGCRPPQTGAFEKELAQA